MALPTLAKSEGATQRTQGQESARLYVELNGLQEVAQVAQIRGRRRQFLPPDCVLLIRTLLPTARCGRLLVFGLKQEAAS